MRIRIRGFGILIFLTLEPGSGINIPDPQHWYQQANTLGKKGNIPKPAEKTGGAGFLNSEVLAATAASDPPKSKDFLARVTGLGRKEEP